MVASGLGAESRGRRAGGGWRRWWLPVVALCGVVLWVAGSRGSLSMLRGGDNRADMGAGAGLRGGAVFGVGPGVGHLLDEAARAGSSGAWSVPVFTPSDEQGNIGSGEAYAVAFLPHPVLPGRGLDESASTAGLGQHPFILGAGCALPGCPAGGFGRHWLKTGVVVNGAADSKQELCSAFMKEPLDRAAQDTEWPPPKSLQDPQITAADRASLTLGERIPVQLRYAQQRYAGKAANDAVWGQDEIDGWVSQARKRPLDCSFSSYPDQNACTLFHATIGRFPVDGKHVLVLGSEKGWLEALLLAAGARHVTTIEYGTIKSLHPQISTFTPADATAALLSGQWDKPDLAFSFSSYEHAGLGRYGDHVYGWSDAFSVAKVSCWLKDGGFFALGVPMGPTDGLYFNLHRVYGPLRLGVLADGWTPLALIRHPSIDSLPPFGEQHGYIVLQNGAGHAAL